MLRERHDLQVELYPQPLMCETMAHKTANTGVRYFKGHKDARDTAILMIDHKDFDKVKECKN